MKSYKNLYPQIYPFSNLYTAYQAARGGKRHRAAVAGFEFDLESNFLPGASNDQRPKDR